MNATYTPASEEYMSWHAHTRHIFECFATIGNGRSFSDFADMDHEFRQIAPSVRADDALQLLNRLFAEVSGGRMDELFAMHAFNSFAMRS